VLSRAVDAIWTRLLIVPQRRFSSVVTLFVFPLFQGQINLYKVRRELSSKLGRMPTLEEIAKHKNVSVEFVNDVVKWHRGMDVSFDNFSDGWDKYTASESGSELLALDEDYLKSDMELCLSTLPAKEGEILRRRYGLGGLPAMTLREIGKLMGMSYEMVRRYEARAMILMRKAQRVERLAAYRPMLGTSEGS
jgi:DNA-directed RNA polymerase sigma subunit (sigma70/sigma32)